LAIDWPERKSRASARATLSIMRIGKTAISTRDELRYFDWSLSTRVFIDIQHWAREWLNEIRWIKSLAERLESPRAIERWRSSRMMDPLIMLLSTPMEAPWRTVAGRWNWETRPPVQGEGYRFAITAGRRYRAEITRVNALVPRRRAVSTPRRRNAVTWRKIKSGKPPPWTSIAIDPPVQRPAVYFHTRPAYLYNIARTTFHLYIGARRADARRIAAAMALWHSV